MAGSVVAIMCAFANHHELSNAEIARLAGLPVSTAHRLLTELVAGGMLERTPERQYRVGPILHAITAEDLRSRPRLPNDAAAVASLHGTG